MVETECEFIEICLNGPAQSRVSAMQFPMIREFKGVARSQIDNVANSLTVMLKLGGMSQMALAVGLCNALSCCLQTMVAKVETQEHRDAMLALEEHLEHTRNILNHLRKNGYRP